MTWSSPRSIWDFPRLMDSCLDANKAPRASGKELRSQTSPLKTIGPPGVRYFLKLSSIHSWATCHGMCIVVTLGRAWEGSLLQGKSRSDSIVHIHASILFQILSHLGYYRILSRVPCAIQKVHTHRILPATSRGSGTRPTPAPSLSVSSPISGITWSGKVKTKSKRYCNCSKTSGLWTYGRVLAMEKVR